MRGTFDGLAKEHHDMIELDLIIKSLEFQSHMYQFLNASLGKTFKHTEQHAPYP